jgi:hypothetical protein
MPLDYKSLANKYKPDNIKVLLIGEAPPPNGETYFYLPVQLNLNQTIENDRSMPATIFNHYCGRRPENKIEYEEFLNRLKLYGIFLIDIYEEHIRIRGRHGLIQENFEIVKANIASLPKRIKNISGVSGHTKLIFLMPRPNYNTTIIQYFINPIIKEWIEFRMDTTEVIC